MVTEHARVVIIGGGVGGTSIAGGRRAVHGRLRAGPGPVGARRHPGRLQPPTAGPGLAAVRGDHGRGHRAGPRDRGRRRHADDQRARGVHPGQRVHPGRERGPRALRRGGVLRPRDRRARAASGARWRPGSWTASRSWTCGGWTSGGSGRSTGAGRTRWPGRYENYATYYDIHYPNEERQAGRPLRTVARVPAPPGAGRGVRGEVGLGAPELVRAERRRGEAGAGSPTPPALEALRPRGWAGSTGARRSAPRRWRRGRPPPCSTRRSFAKIEVAGPGAVALLQRLCANDVDRAVGSVTYTQLLNRRGGIECDLTVTRTAADRFLLVTGTAFGNHDLAWIRRHAPDGRQRAGRATLTSSRGRLRPVGTTGPGHPGRDDDRRRLERRRSRI